MGGPAGLSLYALAVIVLGILAPWYLSFEFVSVPVLVTYACLPLLLVTPVVAESVAAESERAVRPADTAQMRAWLYGKVGAGALYGWVSAVAILALAMASLCLAFGRPVAPPPATAAGLALISLAASVFAASLAAAVAVGARSARSAKRAMRQGLLLLLVLVIYFSRLSGSWKRRLALPTTEAGLLEFAAVVFVVLACISFALCTVALKRSEPAEIHLNL
jgi:hypothetical protein